MSCRRIEERPGMPELLLEHGNASLRLALQGAHITEYVVGGRDLLWVSRSARFTPGAAIRGGIPLCWPWFGASPDDERWPQHGFARSAPFRLVTAESNARHTRVALELESPFPLPEWRGRARLEVEIRLSEVLWMAMRTTNLFEEELSVGAALHSYFQVSDSAAVSIPALTGLDYLDKTEAFARRTQAEPLRIAGEIDRVYQAPPQSVELIDPGVPGRVRIDTWGSTDLVVWNPGPTVAAAMDDFDDEAYRGMLCIEPAIALDHRVRLAPGESMSLGQTIRRLDDRG